MVEFVPPVQRGSLPGIFVPMRWIGQTAIDPGSQRFGLTLAPEAGPPLRVSLSVADAQEIARLVAHYLPLCGIQSDSSSGNLSAAGLPSSACCGVATSGPVLPKHHYPAMQLRCVLPSCAQSGEVGLAFNVSGGPPLRLRLGGSDAALLRDLLNQDQRLPGSAGVQPAIEADKAVAHG